MGSISQVAEFLLTNAGSLAVEIAEDFIHRMKMEVPKEQKEQGIKTYTEFIGFIGKSLDFGTKEMPEGLKEWSKRNGERELSLTGKISTLTVLYPNVQMVYTDHITKVSIEHGLSTEDVVFVNKRVLGTW